MEKVPYPKFLRNPFFRHLLFWAVIIFFFTSPGIFGEGLVLNRLKENLFYVPLDMCATYISLYILLPRVLKKKLFFSTAVIYIAMVIALALISRFLKNNVYTFLDSSLLDIKTPVGAYFNSALIINMIVGADMGIKLFTLWYGMQIKSQELSREKSETELAHLRSQLNPHFLFNTLNNIDSLVLKNPTKGSEALILLSDILRYAVYETQKDRVLLTQEIEYLENYIWLQKIRLSQPDKISLEKSGITQSAEIAPMLLIPIVENAFKHGDKEADSPGISIRINVEENILEFEVINGIRSKSPKDPEIIGGIGLKNLQRRMELQYPNKHEFHTSSHKNKYTALLKLQLS